MKHTGNGLVTRKQTKRGRRINCVSKPPLKVQVQWPQTPALPSPLQVSTTSYRYHAVGTKLLRLGALKYISEINFISVLSKWYFRWI